MKTITFIIITLFLSLSVYSQEIFEPETYFGFKIGGNLSSVYFDPKIEQKLNNGFSGGLIFQHISEKNLGIQMELNYTQSGWNERLDSINSYKRQLNYIQVPFMSHASMGKGKTKLVLNIGPYVSALLSENEKINLLDEVEEQNYYRKKYP